MRITAAPEQAFAHLTDLGKLPELSPESVRCEITLANLEAALEVG